MKFPNVHCVTDNVMQFEMRNFSNFEFIKRYSTVKNRMFENLANVEASSCPVV